jgi:two-component system, LytTR family, sensor kinase
LQLLLAFSVVLAVFYFWGFVYSEQETTPDYVVVMGLIVGSLLSVLVTAIYVAINFMDNWKQALTQAEQLKRESVEARFEVLKSQLDPHFLFNNLNTLVYLVEDNPKAVAFVENLSIVYRYILQNRDKTLVPLADELRLTDAYVFLLRQRFGHALQIHNDIPEFFHDRLIPPMALQLLLENAVKHNVVDTDRPLHVRLYCTDASNLVVQNNLQRRAGLPIKSGVGLQNICHRYELLNGKQPIIQEKTGQFVVILPLIHR